MSSLICPATPHLGSPAGAARATLRMHAPGRDSQLMRCPLTRQELLLRRLVAGFLHDLRRRAEDLAEAPAVDGGDRIHLRAAGPLQFRLILLPSREIALGEDDDLRSGGDAAAVELELPPDGAP